MTKSDMLGCMKKHAISLTSPESPYILASGAKSLYYFDVKRILFNHKCLNIIVKELVRELHKIEFDAVGGMEFGAVPLVAGITLEMPIKSFAVRKERKGHGLKKKIEGNLDDGDRVVIIDDVTTSGTSIMKTIETIRESRPNCQIIKIITVVDREEGAKTMFEGKGIEFSSILKFSEVKPWVTSQLVEKYGIEKVAHYGIL